MGIRKIGDNCCCNSIVYGSCACIAGDHRYLPDTLVWNDFTMDTGLTQIRDSAYPVMTDCTGPWTIVDHDSVGETNYGDMTMTRWDPAYPSGGIPGIDWPPFVTEGNLDEKCWYVGTPPLNQDITDSKVYLVDILESPPLPSTVVDSCGVSQNINQYTVLHGIGIKKVWYLAAGPLEVFVIPEVTRHYYAKLVVAADLTNPPAAGTLWSMVRMSVDYDWPAGMSWASRVNGESFATHAERPECTVNFPADWPGYDVDVTYTSSVGIIDIPKDVPCDCFFNRVGSAGGVPFGGGGCNPFSNDCNPDPISDLILTRNGLSTVTQNAVSYWFDESTIRVPVDTDMGGGETFIDMTRIGSDGYTYTAGKYVTFWNPTGGSYGGRYELDSCTVSATATNTAEPLNYFTLTLNNWSDCRFTGADPVGWCESVATGEITSSTETDCVGTWYADEPVTGCCDIASVLSADVTNSWCTTNSGTWTVGACPVGYCTNDTTGAVTSGVLEADCTGTWSLTEPVTGCCNVSGVEHENVATGWCSVQPGTFSAGACPTGCCVKTGFANEQGVSEPYCDGIAGTWTEGACPDSGWCVSGSTGEITYPVEESLCTGGNTWSATLVPSGCCDISGTENPDVAESWCDTNTGTWTTGACPLGCCALSGAPDESNVTKSYCDGLAGTWSTGSCGPLGWCTDNTNGSVTYLVEENDCSGTWTSTAPTEGCCTITGTKNPNVSQDWCTSQSGTFVAGECPTGTDWCSEPKLTMAVPSFTLTMIDPGADLTDPLLVSEVAAAWSAAAGGGNCTGVDSEPTSPGIEVYGDLTSSPSLSVSEAITATYNSTTNLWSVNATLYFETIVPTVFRTITMSKSGIPNIYECPSFTLSGSFDTFGGDYVQYGGGNTFDSSTMTGTFNITLTC